MIKYIILAICLLQITCHKHKAPIFGDKTKQEHHHCYHDKLF